MWDEEEVLRKGGNSRRDEGKDGSGEEMRKA